jgi:hypothetical protein
VCSWTHSVRCRRPPWALLRSEDLSKDRHFEGPAGVAFLEQAARLDKPNLLTLLVATQVKLERAREAVEQAQYARGRAAEHDRGPFLLCR